VAAIICQQAQPDWPPTAAHRSLEHAHPCPILRATMVLDPARSTSRQPHDLHHGRAENGLHGAHIARAAPAPEFNAQIPQPKIEKQQVNPLQLPRAPNREPSQGLETEYLLA
jgi:hypothetical protein